MGKEETLSNNELPQLRRMVLENTRRINNNEQAIIEMRRGETEERQKLRERDEFWESVERDHALARKEHDRDMRELRQQFKETRDLINENAMQFQETKKLLEKDALQIQETRALNKENALRIQETRALINENALRFKEIEKALDRLDLQSEVMQKSVHEASEAVRQLARQFSGETGHIVEGLISSVAAKVFQKAGLDLHDSGRNLKRKLKSENKQMEVDVLLGNNEVVVPIEVKTNCTQKDISKFLHQMSLFRSLFPEHSDKKVFAAIAAINYEKEVVDFARGEGLLIIRVTNDDVFSIDPFKEEELRRF